MTVSIKEIVDHRKDDFTGKFVLCRSNEDEPIRTGQCLRYEQVPGNRLPVVLMDHDRQTYVVLGIVMKFTAERLAFFGMLEPKEQWRILENEIHRRDYEYVVKKKAPGIPEGFPEWE